MAKKKKVHGVIECLFDELVAIEDLKPHPKNPNSHPPEQLEQYELIMRKNRVREAVRVSNLSGFMTKGHGQALAAARAGWTHVPVQYQDYENRDMEIADMVADNALARQSVIDYNIVNAAVPDFAPNFDIQTLGIPNFEVEKNSKAPEKDEDAVPTKPRRAQTRLGDIYQLGDHRLMCGDSTSLKDVSKLMGRSSADLVFTDPPYGINAVSADGKVGGGTKQAPAKTYRPVLGDESTVVARGAYKVIETLKIPKLVIWGGNYFTDFLPPSPCWLIWDKQRPEGLTFADGEVAWTNFTSPLKFIRHRWDGYHKASERGQDRVHPTQKPAFLGEWCIKEYGEGAKNVLDLFGGSGSTLIACEKTGRAAFLMELDAGYCDVIVSRYEQFTGKKAKLLSKK